MSSSLSSQLSPQAETRKRRQVRKGTRSCWQCKLRKVRCIFTTKSALTCENCKRRKTACVSQEFAFDTSSMGTTSLLDDRVNQLESILGQLLDPVHCSDKLSRFPLNTGRNYSVANSLERSKPVRRDGTTNDYEFANPCEISFDKLTDGSCRIQDLLLACWPNQRESECIKQLPNEMSGLYHATVFAPISESSYCDLLSPKEIMQPPPRTTHPVRIAHQLLLLAVHLQCLSPASAKVLDSTGVDYAAIESIAVKTVRNLVTRDDELLESIEGLQCVMIEALYFLNTGNFRSAWHRARRAMLLAQLLGCHRGSCESQKYLNTNTRDRIDINYTWFQLVRLNRYLSLMLGMLQDTPNNSFADDKVLQNCTPIERMQRMDCVATGYILQRNDSGLFDIAMTHMIDQVLKKSADLVSQDYWRIPSLVATTGFDGLQHISRVMDQLAHLHLITQLHLPHVLCSHTMHQYDYCKIQAINASRELLTRFNSFRESHAYASCCRGITLLAFTACTIICAMHVSVRPHGERRDSADSHLAQMLGPNHQHDRNMMEDALNTIELLASDCRDSIASKTAITLSQLLAVEKKAVLCKQRDITLSEEYRDGYGCGSRLSECKNMLWIHLPQFGTIEFICT